MFITKIPIGSWANSVALSIYATLIHSNITLQSWLIAQNVQKCGLTLQNLLKRQVKGVPHETQHSINMKQGGVFDCPSKAAASSVQPPSSDVDGICQTKNVMDVNRTLVMVIKYKSVVTKSGHS